MKAHCCACGLEHDCVPTAERDAIEDAWAAEIARLTARLARCEAALNVSVCWSCKGRWTTQRSGCGVCGAFREGKP